MSDKCNMCKCYVEDGNCPCHFVNDDELCDFSFELINIAEHDKQIRADAIEEFLELIEKRITESNHGLYLIDAMSFAEQLKENNKCN